MKKINLENVNKIKALWIAAIITGALTISHGAYGLYANHNIGENSQIPVSRSEINESVIEDDNDASRHLELLKIAQAESSEKERIEYLQESILTCCGENHQYHDQNLFAEDALLRGFILPLQEDEIQELSNKYALSDLQEELDDELSAIEQRRDTEQV